MIKYVNDEIIEKVINENEDLILVFGKGKDCSICHAVEHRVNTNLVKKFPKLKVYYVEISENPNFRGQHLIFSVPTLLLFDRNKEVHRESYIIDFSKLERTLNIFYS